MPKRPDLLNLDGLDERAAYREARAMFGRLLGSAPVIDPRSIRVTFRFDHEREDAQDDCWHICFKQDPGAPDPYKRQPRDRFRGDRAGRIPWIHAAIADPDTRIRPSSIPEDPRRESYTLWVPADPKLKLRQEAFGVFVRQTNDPNERAFVTAYTMEQKTADRIKNAGSLIYPAQVAKKHK